MAAAAVRLRELTPAPGAELSEASAAALAECCARLLRASDDGGDAEAARSALDALCSARGGAMRRHSEELAPLVVGRLGDGDAAVREAARKFLVQLMEMKEMHARMGNGEKTPCISDIQDNRCMTIEIEPTDTNQAKKSPKVKIITRDTSLLAGDGDFTRKLLGPIKVFSEKDLAREIEKVASTLHPDNEWAIRITAMQRVEGLVLGGSADYSAFPMLLKQLVTPLITQILDRRSSVVKQACHLLNFLSKELLRDFEPCAELLIPVLLKNVVITIHVIAESSDNCIKEMLRNCKVARILPKIIEFAKNDRSAVLRARCCEYAILMLELWVDTPEIQRSVDLYEEFIKCCIEDATSEVRSSARACYRIFSRIWPERSHQLFSSFESSRQKMINDEDAETHQRHLSPVERVKLMQPQSSSCNSTALDKVVKVDSGTSFSSADLQSVQVKASLQHDDTTTKIQAEGRTDGNSTTGNSFKDTSTLEKETIPDKEPDPDKCDSANNAGVNFSACDPSSATQLALEPISELSSSDATDVTIVQDKVECRPNTEQMSQQAQVLIHPSDLLNISPSVNLKESGNSLKQNLIQVNSDGSSGGKTGVQKVKNRVSTPNKSVVCKEPQNNYTPNFRRPLLSKQMTNWFYASTRGDLDDKQLILGEMVGNMDVPSSLTEALSLGLNPRSDWMMRVYAFNFLRQSLLEQGPRGIQEVAQNFDKVMRLVSRYLDDPHHKIAQAALSSLSEIMPVFKKPFEHYLDKTLPHVFSQLNHPKESIKQQCSAVLKLAGEIYSIDSVLPALLRALEEQKSPKSKLAIIEFANASFVKCTVSSDNYSSSFLKPWLEKLALLFKDKNSKLKEVSVAGFSSIYSHYDPASLLSFIVGLSMEEQKRLRRAIKQLIPTMESDLEEFLQQKKHKPKISLFDSFSIGADQPYSKGLVIKKNKHHQHATYQSDCLKADDVFNSALHSLPRISLEVRERRTGKIESGSSDESNGHDTEMMDKRSSATRSSDLPRIFDHSVISDNTVESPRKEGIDIKRLEESNASELSITFRNKDVMSNNCQDHRPSISKTYHQDTISQMEEVPEINGPPASIKNLHQMSSSLLEMLDDPEESTRELALSLLVEILEKQRIAMENCIDTLIGKLLHATKDAALKVVNQAHICLTTVVTQFDPLTCLRAIAPQLTCQDEKILIVSINSLSKLVIRLSLDNLMAHLSIFLPALLDAFENHSPYVRKAVVLCLVDTYLKLGPAFLPYLERLDSAQLQLVTTYASRLSQTSFIAVDA
ncbi:CLIP-associated protein-like isoform X2 [Oryza brachyantha]|uniref:CLIP-associated protein-like isoform X2 n=1 Tax=Oryza brachyantha TaxID=4533 RepID=UPI001ADC19BC|nr:CLIP-associated protein-like isoform X2 [Oryza brachyantha]